MDGVKWYEKQGPGPELAVSTRVRLARNVQGLPFGERLTREQAESLIGRVEEAARRAAAPFQTVRMDQLAPQQRADLYEKHLISREMMNKSPAALLISQDEARSILVNEEDHLRIQVMSAGEALDKCLEEALRVGALLEESLEFSYDQQLGYLTQCPTNLGAGLRASVMLHLPLLTRTGQIDGVISAASKVGLEIRGLYGEGSRAQGELYQVSNSVTLGFYEQELCEKLKDAAGGIVRQEQALRQAFRQQYPGRLEDRVWRAAGLLRYARRISGQEAEELLSDLRLGVDCGVLAGVAPHKLNQLIYQIKPACLETAAGRPPEPEERDGARADLLRQALREIQEGE